ncbi:zinc-dependent metalloprotease, partial [Mycobacterium tuberculosis]|nr:zinc-dependent metalloprotease [Mycobacterium tuberculosis]
MYLQVVGQFGRYAGHVLKNVGGVYETFKSVEQSGDVYEATPKAIQKSAVTYLSKEVFETPNWLLDKNILNKISSPVANERVQS